MEIKKMGGSPAQVVLGGDSCSECRGFESQHHILHGYFFTYICYKNCNDVCFKRPKLDDERGRGWPVFLKKRQFLKPFTDKTDQPHSKFILCAHLSGCKQLRSLALVVARLLEWLLPISEVRGSNSVIGKIYIQHLYTEFIFQICLKSILLKRRK